MSPQIRGYTQAWRTPVRYASLTLDGQPIVGARLRFQPEAVGGSPSYGSTAPDGRYELGYKRGQKGALIGWHAVRIESGADLALPARYNVQSELRREVKPDEENEFNFELTSDK
jgi:hypothetical protein